MRTDIALLKSQAPVLTIDMIDSGFCPERDDTIWHFDNAAPIYF